MLHPPPGLCRPIQGCPIDGMSKDVSSLSSSPWKGLQINLEYEKGFRKQIKVTSAGDLSSRDVPQQIGVDGLKWFQCTIDQQRRSDDKVLSMVDSRESRPLVHLAHKQRSCFKQFQAILNISR